LALIVIVIEEDPIIVIVINYFTKLQLPITDLAFTFWPYLFSAAQQRTSVCINQSLF